MGRDPQRRSHGVILQIIPEYTCRLPLHVGSLLIVPHRHALRVKPHN